MDLTGPWLAPLQPALGQAWAAWQGGATVADALNAGRPAGAGSLRLAAGLLHFVPQQALPAGEAYEAFIHRTARVPTRDNAHDFFNGLVWLAQPALKRRLNTLQAVEIARRGVGGQRGPLRDALTLFDENGALLQAPPPLWQALRRRDWPTLFITHRALWAQARLTIVGHALLEKLVTAPRKALTAHVLAADAALAMDAEAWASKPFTPLPVLGLPGWWPANADAAFYADAAVFRPAGSPRSTGSARRCRS
ncbi:MAG: DUF3025 domain-containing protein [Pseudomonadota bacterium]